MAPLSGAFLRTANLVRLTSTTLLLQMTPRFSSLLIPGGKAGPSTPGGSDPSPLAGESSLPAGDSPASYYMPPIRYHPMYWETVSPSHPLSAFMINACSAPDAADAESHGNRAPGWPASLLQSHHSSVVFARKRKKKGTGMPNKKKKKLDRQD